MRESPAGCTDSYCTRCCAYGRHFYGIERLSIDEERPCSCVCHQCWREGCAERGVARVGWVAGVWCRAHAWEIVEQTIDALEGDLDGEWQRVGLPARQEH